MGMHCITVKGFILDMTRLCDDDYQCINGLVNVNERFAWCEGLVTCTVNPEAAHCHAAWIVDVVAL